jgi:hypothetical protein
MTNQQLKELPCKTARMLLLCHRKVLLECSERHLHKNFAGFFPLGVVLLQRFAY